MTYVQLGCYLLVIRRMDESLSCTDLDGELIAVN